MLQPCHRSESIRSMMQNQDLVEVKYTDLAVTYHAYIFADLCHRSRGTLAPGAAVIMDQRIGFEPPSWKSQR